MVLPDAKAWLTELDVTICNLKTKSETHPISLVFD